MKSSDTVYIAMIFLIMFIIGFTCVRKATTESKPTLNERLDRMQEQLDRIEAKCNRVNCAVTLTQ